MNYWCWGSSICSWWLHGIKEGCCDHFKDLASKRIPFYEPSIIFFPNISFSGLYILFISNILINLSSDFTIRILYHLILWLTWLTWCLRLWKLLYMNYKLFLRPPPPNKISWNRHVSNEYLTCPNQWWEWGIENVKYSQDFFIKSRVLLIERVRLESEWDEKDKKTTSLHIWWIVLTIPFQWIWNRSNWWYIINQWFLCILLNDACWHFRTCETFAL